MLPQYPKSQLHLHAQYGHNYIQPQQKPSRQQAGAKDHHPSLHLTQLSELPSQLKMPRKGCHLQSLDHI